MRSYCVIGLLVLAYATMAPIRSARSADVPARRPLAPKEREAVLSLIKAVDLAQEIDAASNDGLSWDSHVFKSSEQVAYVPFRLTLDRTITGFKSATMYVRAVSRRDGTRVSEERSFVRDWVVNGDAMPRNGETVFLMAGESPVGGPGIGAARRSVAQATQSSTVLALRDREYERQRRAAEEAKKKEETRERDPLLFPFEDYYFVDLGSDRTIERAISLPPGEYDVFVALLDSGRPKTSSPAIVKRTVTVPNFWNDRLALSSLILAREVHPLKAPLQGSRQIEHPYTLGQTEVIPVATPSFSTDDVLSVVFQMCNYGAPDSDLTAEYNFFRVDGARRLFNHTDPQQYTDADLPPPGAWTTQALVMQNVLLRPFPAGRYELEVTLRDRLTRSTARQTVAFTVASGVR